MQDAKIYHFPTPSDRQVEEKRGPQVEDGYTRIANPILDALCCADFNAREFRVVHFVIRTTYGWNTKACRMTGEFIAKKVKLDPSRCSKVLNELVRRRVLIRHGGSRSPVSLNKHSEEWIARDGANRRPPTKRADSAQDEPTQSAQDEPTNKDRKDNSVPKGTDDTSKKSPPRKWGEPIDHELVTEMVAAVSADLDAPVKHNPTTWANEFRLMRERDGRTVEQIRYLITWTARHDFWAGIVLSPKKLRDKWDQLAKQVKQQHKPKSSSGRHTGLQAPSTEGLIDRGDGTYEF